MNAGRQICGLLLAAVFIAALPCPAQDTKVQDKTGQNSEIRSEVAIFDPAKAVGLQGGLVVQLGGRDTSSAAMLSRGALPHIDRERHRLAGLVLLDIETCNRDVLRR